jgi:hypothetical protein
MITSSNQATNRIQNPAYRVCTITGAPYAIVAADAFPPGCGAAHFGQYASPGVTEAPHFEQNKAATGLGGIGEFVLISFSEIQI